MLKLSAGAKKEIHDLSKAKEYDKIYIKYGQEIFCKSIPKRLKDREIKQLIKQGRFIEIYNKYGEKEFNKLSSKIKVVDKKWEKKGINLKLPVTTSSTIGKIALKQLTAMLIALPMLSPAISAAMLKSQLKDSNQLDAILEYEANIKKYSEEFKKDIEEQNLSEIDIYMKVMKEMHDSIEGYGRPGGIVAGGYHGLTLQEEGRGVCLNFADDVARKLNEIDDDFNARIFILNIDPKQPELFQLANIERNTIEVNETIISSENEEINVENEDDNNKNNHAVVAVDSEINGKKITLFIDPTNPCIGVYRNGEIDIFNTPEKNAMHINSVYKKCIVEGIDSYTNVLAYMESYLIPITDEEYEELSLTYGIEAQNASLEKLEEIERSEDFSKGLNLHVNDNQEILENSTKINEEIQKEENDIIR